MEHGTALKRLIEYAEDIESKAHVSFEQVQVAAAEILIGGEANRVGDDDLENMAGGSNLESTTPTVESDVVAEHQGAVET